MKKSLLLCFVLIINLSFAQENAADVLKTFSNQNKNVFSLNTNEKAKFLKFQEIVPIAFEKRTDVNEGKFSLNYIKDKSITSLLSELDEHTKTSILSIEEIKTPSQSLKDKKSIIIATNEKFINNLITAKIIQAGLVNETKNYKDREANFYNNYPEMIDLLRVNYMLAGNLELQIGNSVYPFLNNSFKTELDNTLLYSLNLLAINF
jgi:hypothetical protein